jgi:hypothetical protein
VNFFFFFSPRTNQRISDLNTRNMEFFRLELEGICLFEILEAQNSDFFFLELLFLSSTSSLSRFSFFFLFFISNYLLRIMK